MDPHAAHKPSLPTKDTQFSHLEGLSDLQPYPGRPRSWHSVSNPRLATTWDKVQDETSYLYNAPSIDRNINMTSLYYWISKGAPISQARKLLITSIFGNDYRMVRSYSGHGREQSTIVQLTCHTETVEDFKSAMNAPKQKELPESYDPLSRSPNHPTRENSVQI